MKILTIDTADKDASIFLQEENKLISYKKVDNNKQAEILTIDIENILSKNHFEYKDLDCISIVNGPGSFMGLKISVCIAKAIACVIPKIKIIKNNLFEILSYKKKYDYIVLDAGFNGFYISDKNKNYFYTKTEMFEPNKNEILLTNSEKVMDLLKVYNIFKCDSKKDDVINLNYLKYNNGIFENENLTPLYIREAQINKKL